MWPDYHHGCGIYCCFFLCQALHSDKKGKFLVFPWKYLIAYESLGRRLNLPVIWPFGLTAHCGTCSLTLCSCRKPMINCDVIGHFYLLLFPLHNLCLTSQYFITSSFHFLSSILWFLFYDLPHTSSGFCSHFSSLLAYFPIPYSISMLLCSVSILSLHHLSIIPRLPSPSLTTQHFVPCDSASHMLHSPYYSIHCITLSPVV